MISYKSVDTPKKFQLKVFQLITLHLVFKLQFSVLLFILEITVRFAQYRSQHQQLASRQLNLKPLFFEVPLQEPDPLFLGRDWLVKELEELTSYDNNPGVLLIGLP